MSSALQDFIKQCTEREAHNRPTTAELLCHPFLEKACDLSDLIPLVVHAREDAKNAYLSEEEDAEYDDY